MISKFHLRNYYILILCLINNNLLLSKRDVGVRTTDTVSDAKQREKQQLNDMIDFIKKTIYHGNFFSSSAIGTKKERSFKSHLPAEIKKNSIIFGDRKKRKFSISYGYHVAEAMFFFMKKISQEFKKNNYTPSNEDSILAQLYKYSSNYILDSNGDKIKLKSGYGQNAKKQENDGKAIEENFKNKYDSGLIEILNTILN